MTTEIAGAGARSAGRPPGGGQGQHRGRGRADDERVGRRAAFHPAARRHRRQPAARPPARLSRARRSARTCASPAAATRRGPGRFATRGTGPVRGRVVQRQRRAGRGRPGRPGARRRPGRVDPDPEFLLRHGRAQANVRAGPVHRRVPDREHPGPPGPDHPHRAGRSAAARRAGRPGRAGPEAAPGPAVRGLPGRAGGGRRRAADRRGRGGLRHPGPFPARGRRDRPGRDQQARGRPAPRSPRSACRGTGTQCTSGTSSPPTAWSAR